MLRGLKDCITETDGESIDVIRLLLIAGVICFLILSIFDVIVAKHPFEFMGFGTGLGGLLGGGGSGMAIRGRLEK